MIRFIPRSVMFGILAFTPALALANAVVESVKGTARVGTAALSANQRLGSNSVITTGAGSQVIMKFDDGQQVVLNENTEFRIVEYRYSQADPKGDRSIMDLVKGALRVVTGVLGQRNASAFQLRAPQATIGIRGTDFMVALVNPAYVSVIQGAVGVTNAAGSVAFGAGAIGTVATSATLAVAIPAAALPAAASAAFSSLSAATVGAAGAVGAGTGTGTGTAGTAGAAGTAGGAATGAAAATTATTIGGVGIGTAAAIGAAVAGVAAVATQSDSTTTHTTTTTHTP